MTNMRNTSIYRKVVPCHLSISYDSISTAYCSCFVAWIAIPSCMYSITSNSMSFCVLYLPVLPQRVKRRGGMPLAMYSYLYLRLLPHRVRRWRVRPWPCTTAVSAIVAPQGKKVECMPLAMYNFCICHCCPTG